MRVHGKLCLLAVSAILALAGGMAVQVESVAATTAQAKSVGTVEFQERLLNWAVESEKRFGTGSALTEKIAVLTDEQVEMFMSAIDDPKAFLAATEQVVRAFAAEGADEQAAEAIRQDAPQGSRPSNSRNLMTLTPFSTDYPPNSGNYKTVIIDGINFFGIPATNTERCGSSQWADYVAVWFPLWKAIDTLDGACIVTGCDPTGVSCFVACGILETAKLALKVAAAPLDACSVHDGAIDGGELEATYENVRALLRSVELRRLHLQVLELAERKRYLVVATEAGAPVDVELTAIQAFDEQAGSFVNVSTASVTEVDSGTYVLKLNLPECDARGRQPRHNSDSCPPDKIFRLKVEHADAVDHPQHFGQVVFHRTASRGLATGQ